MAVDAAIAAAWRAAESLGATGAAVYAAEPGGALVCLSAFGGDTAATRRPSASAVDAVSVNCRWELEGLAGRVGRLEASFLSNTAPPPFSSDFQQALDGLASALERRRAERALARSHVHAQMLYRVTALAHPRSSGDDALLAIVRALVADAGFTTAAIYRFGEGQLIREAWETTSQLDEPDEEAAALESVALRCVLTRTTQTEGFPAWEPDGGVEPAVAACLMAAPLLRDDLALGALAVARVGADDNAAETRFVEMLAESVGLALENVGTRPHLVARLHEKAAYAQEELETVVRESPAGLVALDDGWRILRLNPAACAILACEEANALGQPFIDVLKDARVIEGLAALIRQDVGEGRRPTLEARLDGERCDVLLGIARLGPGYLVSLSDITALKDVDRLKSEIIANVSHEFRAPLASIKAYNELLLAPGIGDDATRRRFLAIIGEETDYLTELITNMLDLSRLQSGHLELTYTWLDLSRLVGDVVNMLAAQAEARRIKFNVRGGDATPLLWADRQLMIMVLKNLIANAVKYNRVGGHVTVEMAGDGDEVTLRVRDDGVGIPESAIPQLFDKFFRVVSTTESGIQGTGLGLALTRAAVDAHGGSVYVNSREGHGAEFTVTLPNRALSGP
ncbi:MAG: ATP-binding protein [Anaerolineae bacterium]